MQYAVHISKSRTKLYEVQNSKVNYEQDVHLYSKPKKKYGNRKPNPAPISSTRVHVHCLYVKSFIIVKCLISFHNLHRHFVRIVFYFLFHHYNNIIGANQYSTRRHLCHRLGSKKWSSFTYDISIIVRAPVSHSLPMKKSKSSLKTDCHMAQLYGKLLWHVFIYILFYSYL